MKQGCLLVAQSGHHDRADQCPLSGVKQTWINAVLMSLIDPKRTFVKLTHLALSQ